MAQTALDRFMAYVVKTGDCWLWTGAVRPGDGRPLYGRKPGSKSSPERAARAAYRLFVGPIHGDNEIHHRCENSACVNPDHLEQLTPEEHRLKHAVTECPAGHAYDEANTLSDGERREDVPALRQGAEAGDAHAVRPVRATPTRPPKGDRLRPLHDLLPGGFQGERARPVGGRIGRVRRWHEDLALMQARSRSFLAAHRPGPLGTHRKRHPGDCGRAGCGLCHGDKLYGPKRRVNERRDAIQLELSL